MTVLPTTRKLIYCRENGRLLIDEHDECIEIVYHAMYNSQSMHSATVIVNRFCLSLEVPVPEISWSAVQSLFLKII